ncbi:hypothetical protein EOJ36_08255 [Sandaracinomonas limnophila]|jgi:hypothetical protein|uniref:Uncharacterized protein n=1 Tax=Sandaracinomonas limnophila TaxID=1862386 RepID=A0A437PRW8_9BACT|nr:hypothetical protein [Sandaracinomonas limnophila]RVU24987.1 hypothetical protein EOJ36_08255 [Sandaracinomonas limnophila]
MALISKKKELYRINNQLRKYLIKYNREYPMTISYEDLHRYENAINLYDKNGKDTLWQTVYYSPNDQQEVYEALKRIYADLKTDGNEDVIKHLVIDRVDFCTYGNTFPFRVRIVNEVNDNFDYFYIKQADASRVYGLELEHILSPNRINYVTYGNTLVEEHIAGVPGDVFLNQEDLESIEAPIRLAKEFVKFNERCLVQLLGDMHSANYVIITTPDFEEIYYRIRPIDFDQQCYEGKKSVYLPQYFKQNNPLIDLGMKYMTSESMHQYQIEERSMIASRLKSESQRVYDLMEVMAKDEIAPFENVKQLRKELSNHYKDNRFLQCETMGQIVWHSLELVRKH